MNIWILTGIMLLAPVSSAFAAEIADDSACQADTTRQDVRIDAQQPAPPPATDISRRPTTTIQRDAAASATVHADAARRRSGKPIPDSELIAPHGTL